MFANTAMLSMPERTEKIPEECKYEGVPIFSREYLQPVRVGERDLEPDLRRLQ